MDGFRLRFNRGVQTGLIVMIKAVMFCLVIVNVQVIMIKGDKNLLMLVIDNLARYILKTDNEYSIVVSSCKLVILLPPLRQYFGR